MTDRRRLRPWMLFPALALPPVLVLGCTRPAGSLELTSYKDPYFPETYDVKLADCAYYVDPGGDYHIAGWASHNPDDGTGQTIRQLVHVHLFWKPWPGKTFDDPTGVDATIRYAIVTERGAAVYSGTGFVYPKKRRLSDEVIVKIENARLRLESQAGDLPELLGVARLAGRLVAQDEPSLALDVRRELELHAASEEAEH